MLVATALLSTIALAWALNRIAFPPHGIAGARIALIAALAAAAAFGAGLPLIRLKRAWRERHTELALPEPEENSGAIEEYSGSEDVPLNEPAAVGTPARMNGSVPAKLASARGLFAWSALALTCFAALVWMIASGPNYLGYGASLIWTGTKRNIAPLYGITVKPGNLTVWRNSSQLITAEVNGIAPEKAQIFSRFQSSAGWEPVAMQAAPDSSGGATYRFIFAGLSESVEYYITAGPLVSPHYKLRVVDVPTAKQISVTRH